MGKESWWLGWWKRIFVCRSRLRLREEEEEDKKENKRRIEEATQKQRKYALEVATATAAAAEAAVSAAHAAAHILHLTLTASGTASSGHNHNQNHKHKQTAAAAIQIQTAFRRYLARKALVALKGVVKLQAIIRGQSVRRRILINFNPLFYPFNHSISGSDNHMHNNITKVVGCKTQRRWDYRMLSKEDVETLCSKKHQCANIQRDRIMMKYSFSHRERRTTNSLMTERESALPKRPETARHSQFQDLHMNKHADLFVRTSSSTRKQDDQVGLYSIPRRSFCRAHRINSTAEEDSVPNSPVSRTYMSATESAKAKARSVSTPRQRLLTQLNGLSPHASYNDVFQFSPYSCKLKSPLLA